VNAANQVAIFHRYYASHPAYHPQNQNGTPLPLLVEAQNLATSNLLLQSVVILGDKTDEGRVIETVAPAWFEIARLLKSDPDVLFKIHHRKMEELIAGAYTAAGFEEVTLTSASGDLGRDVIAVKRGLGTVRIIDQVKAHKPEHLVDANDVRALMGVLHADGASKGFVTTTSDFAPLIRTDPLIAPLIPSRLGLVNGTELIRRLVELAEKR
jgi:restriction system protein